MKRIPAADGVLDKYLLALGGAQRLAAVTSLVAQGSRQDIDDVLEK